MPSLSSTSWPGAEAPKRSMATLASTHSLQPIETPASTDTDASAERQHRLAVVVVLGAEQLPRRHRHDPRADPLGLELLGRRDRDPQLAAGADDGRALLGAVRRRPQHVRAARHALGARARPAPAGPGATAPSAPGPRCPRGSSATRTAVSLASPGRSTTSPGIARSAARCSTGWWVGPSSPSADRVVRVDPRHVEPAQRAQPDRAAHVVGELHERRPVRAHDAAVGGHAVDDPAHAVLAHAEEDVAPRPFAA